MIEEDVARLALAVQEIAKALILVGNEFDKIESRFCKIEERLKKLESK
jgi:hypothetical protein